MIHSNFHTHTCYGDGKNTVDEIAQAAISRGFRAIGYSGHSPLFFDQAGGMEEAVVPNYVADVLSAQKRYAGRLEVYLGVEDDVHGVRPRFQREFTIGSVHNIRRENDYLCVDDTEQLMRDHVRRHFGGDYYRYCAAYFEEVAQVQRVTGCDFVGHVDLVTKFNEGGKYFDETDPRYLRPALEAIEYLCSQGSVFEINTGAISRGYRTTPYPSPVLLRAIRQFGSAIVISSDSHSAGTLDAYFSEAIALAQECGYRTCRVLTREGWQDAPLDGDFL